MKKLTIALALGLGLVLVPAAARADVICTDKLLGPLQLPISVCVQSPLLPSLPPIVPPLPVLPPAAPTVPVKPVVPAQPAPAPSQPTSTSGSGVTPSQAPKPTPTHTPAPTRQDPMNDHSESDFEELLFPLSFFALLVFVLFGGWRLYDFLQVRREKNRAESE